jgi:hypothetical protein
MDLQEIGRRRALDLSVSGCGQMTGCCGHGNEPSYSIKCEEFVG